MKVDTITISIIVPIYNIGAGVLKTLSSIHNQTFYNWECLCVDDGSKDDSAHYVEQFAREDGRVRLLKKNNEGTGFARNAGLRLARGKYIMFSDQDDILHPQSFELAVAAMERTGADLLTYRAVGWPADVECVFENYKSLEGCHVKCTDSPFEDYVKQRSASPCVWHRCFRRSLLEGVLFPALTGGEDRVFMYRVLLKSVREAHINAILYFHLENPKSVTRSKSAKFYQNELSSYEVIAKDFLLTNRDTRLARVQISRKACDVMKEIAFAFSSASELNMLNDFSSDLSLKFEKGVLARDKLWLYEKGVVSLFLARKYGVLRLYCDLLDWGLSVFRVLREPVRKCMSKALYTSCGNVATSNDN